MKYGIKHLTIGTLPFIEITEDEFRHLKEAKKNVIIMIGIEEKFDFLIENYAEYEEDLLKTTLHYMLHRRSSRSESSLDVLQVNRRVGNLLSAARLYLDQIRHDISTMYGSASPQAATIKQKTHVEYDSVLGYRVMEELRDYAQHRSLPVHGMGYPSRREEKKGGVIRVKFSINPVLYVDQLAEDPKFKPRVLQELHAIGNDVLLTPLIRQYIEALARVHGHVRDTTADDCTRWDTVLNRARDTAKTAFGEDAPFWAAVAETDDAGPIEKEDLVDHLTEYRQLLKRKNELLDFLASRYVSGESESD